MTDRQRSEPLLSPIEELRRLNATLVDAELDDATADEIGHLVRQATTLAQSVPASRWWERRPLESTFGQNSPFRGKYHPCAPKVEVSEIADGQLPHLQAVAELGSLYEGPPGVVHGGMIAALFDEIMAAVQVRLPGGGDGRTGRLIVKYRKATPLHVPLIFEAWVADATGRRSIVEAELRVDGAVTASAEALFVRPRRERP